MTDLSNYKHFKLFESPIMDHIKQNYQLLKDDFFNNVSQSPLLADKPGYKFLDGVTDLYKGKIHSIGLKNSRIALDADELRIMKWAEHEQYRRNYRRITPNLVGPWVDFVNLFDHQLEQMFFNIAWPGASITPHKGIHTSYFRVHICLQTNAGFCFDIEGEKKAWIEGVENSFAFDDAHRRHGVTYTDQGDTKPRIVAILDVKKEYYPELFGL